MIAAAKSKTGVLGFVGGMDIPLIHKCETGYEEGARAVNPNIRVIDNYVGVTDGAWNNPGKGKELALNQIEKGADVIFTAAGNSGLGAFDAVEQYGRDATTGQANKFVIGVDSNQNGVKPGFVLTSMVKRVDNAVYDVVKEVLGGQFKGGFHAFGLDKDGVAYAMDNNNAGLIPEDVLKRVEETKGRIVAGEIKVTDAMATK
jgi:basic membrane protein A